MALEEHYADVPCVQSPWLKNKHKQQWTAPSSVTLTLSWLSHIPVPSRSHHCFLTLYTQRGLFSPLRIAMQRCSPSVPPYSSWDTTSECPWTTAAFWLNTKAGKDQRMLARCRQSTGPLSLSCQTPGDPDPGLLWHIPFVILASATFSLAFVSLWLWNMQVLFCTLPYVPLSWGGNSGVLIFNSSTWPSPILQQFGSHTAGRDPLLLIMSKAREQP